MLLLKACPRCRGDLQEKSDVNGRYLSCVQCSFMKDLPSIPIHAKKKKAGAPDYRRAPVAT